MKMKRWDAEKSLKPMSIRQPKNRISFVYFHLPYRRNISQASINGVNSFAAAAAWKASVGGGDHRHRRRPWSWLSWSIAYRLSSMVGGACFPPNPPFFNCHV